MDTRFADYGDTARMEGKPLISIITPTNNPRFLEEIHGNLDAQTYQDWEWIIMPNGDAVIPLLNDPRIRVVDDVAGMKGLFIGSLKRKCAMRAKGDVILELDHDDFLSLDALEKVAAAFTAGAEFVFSDFAEFFEHDRSPRTYGGEWGWRYRHVTAPNGMACLAANAHPCRPPWILNITHAPNHVRAWSTKAYWEIGGHDAALEVGDDYDLVVRTYLANKKVTYIPECLYFYRVFAGSENTHIAKNAKIQQVVNQRYASLFYDMMLMWCHQDGLLALDFGAAHGKPGAQYVGVDLEQAPGVDVIADLSKPWPWADNSVGLIRCHDFIEHIADKLHFMHEAYRVLAHGGIIDIEVPSTDGRGAFQDPTHCCHSYDTEVLTNQGFKLFSDLDGTEKVWTLNPDTNEAEIADINEIHEYDFNGKLILFSSRNTDCLVTPNHRMYVGSSDETTSMKFVEASKVSERRSCSRIPHEVVFHGATPEYFEVPDSRVVLYSNPNRGFPQDTLRLPMKQFVRFLGWYVSEGYTSIEANSDGGARNFYRVGVCQSVKANPTKYEMIGEVIRELGFAPYRDETGWYFNCKPLAIWLAKLGHSHEKYIPRQVLELDPSLLVELIEGLSLGDGHLRGSGFIYGTTSPQLASDVFELGIRLGYRVSWSKEARVGNQVLVNPDYRANYDMHLIYFSRSKARYISKFEHIPYAGKVYCVTASKNGIICTRRNGKMIWSGNSFWNENSMWYYTRETQRKYVKSIKCSFSEQELMTHHPNEWCAQNKIPYVRARLCAAKDPSMPLNRPHPPIIR
jgi:hypothetical protein